MKTYCKSCGHENTYIGQKPEKCYHCQESLAQKIIPIQSNNIYVNDESEKRETSFNVNNYNADTIHSMVSSFTSSIIQDLNKKNGIYRNIKLDISQNGHILEREE